MAKDIYTIDNISKRSRGIIENFGGVNEIINYYRENSDFFKIRGVGILVNNELINFCEEAILNDGNNSEEIIEKNIIVTENNFKGIEYNYLNLKLQLSNRSLNAIKYLEFHNKYDESIGNKINYFQVYFFDSFNFNSLKNVGIKSQLEIISLKNKLNESFSSDTNENELDIKKTFSLIFDIYLQNDELNDISEYNKVDLIKALVILICNQKLTNKQEKILKLSFFSDVDVNEIIKLADCSREYIKITTTELEKNIKKLSYVLKSGLKEDNIYLYEFENDFIKIQKIDNFTFKQILYTPNLKLTKIVFNVIYNEYRLLDDIIEELDENLSFKNIDLMISKEFLKKTNFELLIKFLNQEIYNFEIVGFEYNFKILISRFYNENNYLIDNELMPTLYKIIQMLIKDNWEINQRLVNKNIKQEFKSNLISHLEDYLINKKEAEKTAILLDFIIESGIQINLSELLDCLNSYNSFVRIGNGFWIHKDYIDSSKIKGSIFEISLMLFNEKDRPIHISEIYDYISPYRDVTIKSLITNIQTTGKGIIEVFNCNFYGLKNKNYDPSWKNLDKFVYSRNKKILLDFNLSLDEKIRLLKLNGVPELHTKYILNKKYK
jgi:hypothetical protein